MNQNSAEVELITHFRAETEEQRQGAGAEHPRHARTCGIGPFRKARTLFVEQQTVQRRQTKHSDHQDHAAIQPRRI